MVTSLNPPQPSSSHDSESRAKAVKLNTESYKLLLEAFPRQNFPAYASTVGTGLTSAGTLSIIIDLALAIPAAWILGAAFIMIGLVLLCAGLSATKAVDNERLAQYRHLWQHQHQGPEESGVVPVLKAPSPEPASWFWPVMAAVALAVGLLLVSSTTAILGGLGPWIVISLGILSLGNGFVLFGLWLSGMRKADEKNLEAYQQYWGGNRR